MSEKLFHGKGKRVPIDAATRQSKFKQSLRPGSLFETASGKPYVCIEVMDDGTIRAYPIDDPKEDRMEVAIPSETAVKRAHPCTESVMSQTIRILRKKVMGT